MKCFILLLVICVTSTPMVICQSDKFCPKYKILLEEMAKAYNQKDKRVPLTSMDFGVPNLKFIPTKDKLYLYLDKPDTINTTQPKGFIYELDLSCSTAQDCPKIGEEKPLSDLFGGQDNLQDVYYQDSFTYIRRGWSPQGIRKYENSNYLGEINETEFWRNVSHATVYEWSNNVKTVKSRFVPPKSPKGPLRYGFSFDTFNGKTTVEVQGNYEMVNIVKHMVLGSDDLTLYTFGDYLVPHLYYGYLPLPNGDDIFNFAPKPAYIRKNDVSLQMYRTQNLYQLFGCDPQAIPEKTLTDTRSDNIYPPYFS